MTNCNCNNRFDCTLLAITASIIVGIATAILSFTAIITVAPVFLWAILGVAVVYLAIVFVSSIAVRRAGINDCVCGVIPLLLIGILGTILASVVLLAITFAATSVLGAIINGALLAAVSLIFTASACFVKCVVNRSCERVID